MDYSKEDFGYFFTPRIENDEKTPLNKANADLTPAPANKDVVVDVNPDQNESNPVGTENPAPLIGGEPGLMDGAHPQGQQFQFSKGELDFKLLSPREVDHNFLRKVELGRNQVCCTCCCCLAFLMTWVGALLIFISNQGGFIDEEKETEDALFFTGSGFLFAACCCWTIACLTCCALCVSLCGGGGIIKDKDKVELKPHQDFEIKLERWNDKYDKADDAMLKLRFNAFSEAFTAVPSFSSTNSRFFKAKDLVLKQQKTLVANRITEMMNQGASPELITRNLRPTCFRIEFKGDMMVSNISTFREQISTAIRLGMPGVDVVLVIVSSPGGAVSGYGLAASQLVRIKNAGLKLIICVDSIAASGGYMMASVGDEIYAAPFALVGSIGVISIIPNIEGLLNEYKIKTNVLTSGEFKNTVNVVGPITEEGIKKHLEDLEKIHQAFKHHIVLNRPILEENIDEIGTGEAFLAVEARKLGLVDYIKTSDELLEEMGRRYEIINLRVKNKRGLPELFQTLGRSFTFGNFFNNLFSKVEAKEALSASAEETKGLLRHQSPTSFLV